MSAGPDGPRRPRPPRHPYRRVMPRRTFLRGVGGVAIGLPFLEPMLRSSAYGSPPPAPVRCVTLFHGLGVPHAMQAEGFDGPLGPLAAHADKLTIFRNVSMHEARGQGHPAGGTCVFVGAAGRSRERAGGPSIEQALERAAYPMGTPTPIGTLAAGTFFRRSHGLYQRIRCWNEDGARVVEPYESPVALFEALFGRLAAAAGDADDPAVARRERLRRSVLDAVMGEYAHWSSEASNLGVASRRRLRDHLDRLRALERRVYSAPPMEGPGCGPFARPAEPDLPYGVSGATEYDAVRVPAAAFEAAFRLLVDLFAMAMRCDLVRFGSLMFESSGGHTAFTGTHRAPGHTYAFRSEASVHNAFHENRRYHMRWSAHWFQTQMAYAIAALDDPELPEPTGRTLFDDTLVVLGTEVGTNHDMNGVLHAVGGGAGRLRAGGFHDAPVSAVDVYTTCLQAYGVEGVHGDPAFFGGTVDALLA